MERIKYNEEKEYIMCLIPKLLASNSQIPWRLLQTIFIGIRTYEEKEKTIMKHDSKLKKVQNRKTGFRTETHAYRETISKFDIQMRTLLIKKHMIVMEIMKYVK